ncbi:ABC transporter ATP-binding protein [Sodalis sp. C49]|uniref:ABC transporter ATP-binding protein n=1 Tax=Sodalis sp. C49 TaxID=3228929 RepID=UPI003965BA5D
MNNGPLIAVRRLKKYFPINDGLFGQATGVVHAVDDVSFTIRRGTIFGLVGESGSGKTTVGRTLLGLYPASGGSVIFYDNNRPDDGKNFPADDRPRHGHGTAPAGQAPERAGNGRELTGMSSRQWQSLRPKMQLVFQDPYSSLNPRLRVGDAIGEALLEHGLADKHAVRDRVVRIMETCGLSAQHYDRFPHEFSGGQRQRIGIARALILQPDFIVADEPISALDVSIQAQIINLFADLRDDLGVTFLFISHDLGVVEHLCDDVAVMYLGQIVERADRDSLFRRPLHPYTQALLAAVPTLDVDAPPRPIALGEPPSPAEPPPGCRFHTRCPYATDLCRRQPPVLLEAAPGHSVSCHYAGVGSQA